MNKIIRGGRLLDIEQHAAEPADILVEGDTVREIGPPGMAAPPRGHHARRLRPAAHARTRQCPHPRPQQPRQERRRPLDPGAAAQRRTLDHRRAHARGQVPLHPHRRGGDGAQGMHRRLRSELRVPGSDRARPGSRRPGLRRCRNARGGGPDDGRPHLSPCDPRPPWTRCRRLRGARRKQCRWSRSRPAWRRGSKRARHGPSPTTRCDSRSRRRFRTTAARRSCAPRTARPTSTAQASTPTSRSPRSRPSPASDSTA